MSAPNRDAWAAPDPNAPRQSGEQNFVWSDDQRQPAPADPGPQASYDPRQAAHYACAHTSPIEVAYPAGAAHAGKSRVAAGMLGILLGAFGAHNFYLGRTGLGVAQLLITLLSFGVLWYIPAIWGVAEGICYLASNAPRWSTDADGRPLYR